MTLKPFRHVTSVLAIALFLGIPLSSLGQIPVSGLADKTVYVDQVTFNISNQVGFTYDARLDGNPVSVGSPVSVNRVEYHELSIFRTNTSTLEATNQLTKFIVRSSERGE